MTDDRGDADHGSTGVERRTRRPSGGRTALERFDAEFLAPQPPPDEPAPPSFAERALGAPPSPLDRIDRLFQQTPRRIWWGVAALGAVVVLGLVWTAVVDRVVTVQSDAVIVPPDGLFSVGLPQAGQIQDVAVEAGDTVSAGATLAELRVADVDEPVQVQSPIDGTVLVVGGRDGEVVAAGTTLFVIAPDQDVVAIGLFPADAISSLEAGQDASVTINGVSPDRYGRVRAHVLEVADVPTPPSRLAQLTGDLTLATALSEQGLVYEVVVELDRDETPSGLAWTRGDGPEQAVPIGALAEVSIVVERGPLIRDVLG
jgi:multidrug efflux pump subunit AcrA (membrane-fusion protein)